MKNSLAIAYQVKRKSKGSTNKVDRANFLSDEDKESHLQFPDAISDEELLDESGFNPESSMDNTIGNEDQAESRSEMVARIMRKMRSMNR